jgi:hypothetical protein
MLTLVDQLQAMPYRDVRGVAIRLGLRNSDQNQKAAWIDAIQQGWRDADQRQHWVGQLSLAALRALARLLAAQTIPAPLFWAEYGRIRQATSRHHWDPAPWQEPTSVSEELYYSGLLSAYGASSLARAAIVTLPTDLRPLLAPQLMPVAVNRSPSPSLCAVPAWPLCHDIGQLLIYGQTQLAPRRPSQPWLNRAQVAALRSRLWSPQAAIANRSHRSQPYLRLLAFLAAVGELQIDGQVTPRGWAWLAATAGSQFAELCTIWLTATPEEQRHYQLPGGLLGAPWPQPLVRQLRRVASQLSFTVNDLVHGLLGAPDESPAFWVANVPSLTALDQLVTQTVDEVLLPLGVVEGTGGEAARVYTVTPVGQGWLTDKPIAGPEEVTPAAVLQSTPDQTAFWLDLGAQPGPTMAAQAQVARYGEYEVPPARSPQRHHRYLLTARTLARAAAAGHGLPTLAQAFSTLGLPLPTALYAQLAAWHSAGRQVQVQYLPLLRTTTPAQLAAIVQEPSLQGAVGEVLAPTVAVIASDLTTFAQHFAQAGYFASTPPHELTLTENQAARAALWLAGQLYAQLGAHLALPLPPPFAALDRLWAGLADEHKALLHAQLQQLHDHLLDLLDHLPFTPPPHPTDPAHWRAAIDQAIADKRPLELTYFSAGRNLTTRRRVDPYWVEERRGVPYLRAYCHSAGRVLTFRLDRIEGIKTGD